MKAKILICTLVLMFSAFAGSVFGGTEGATSTAYGTNAGYNASYYDNTFIGAYAGYSNTASFNTFVGTAAGRENTSGNNNTYIGHGAGEDNTSGSFNTFLGTLAGFKNTGYENTFLGDGAGAYNTGNSNTFVGTAAGGGPTNSSGSGNVFIGETAGYYETGSNKLYIANSVTLSPLIWGDFSNSTLIVNGSLGVSNALTVNSINSTIGVNGNIGINSNLSVNGQLGVNGYLGIGGQTPVRMFHMAGPNAVFRMDRTADTAAFQMVRTDISGNPLKVFVVGTNASGPSTGEFVINDNGTALSGPGTRRMTMANNGDVTFTGNVFANSFGPSSLTLKDNVRTYENALDTVNRLRGVSFDWKDSGKPSVGLIAEEVAKVVPEVVAYNDGAATGVNYASLVGVLVEAVKEQQAIVKEQEVKHQAEMDSLKVEVQQLRALLQER